MEGRYVIRADSLSNRDVLYFMQKTSAPILLVIALTRQILSNRFFTVAGVSRGKGQDLFLKGFYEALQLIKERKLKVPPMHAVIVGSDMGAQTKFETELRNFVSDKKIQENVHFVNKTLNVAPYLASIDVLVQNSQVPILIAYVYIYALSQVNITIPSFIDERLLH